MRREGKRGEEGRGREVRRGGEGGVRRGRGEEGGEEG